MSVQAGNERDSKHLVLEVEIPAVYTADLEDYREFEGEFESESEWLMNCICQTSICRLRSEIEGDKDSSIIESWGYIRGARLDAPSRGYGPDPHVTDEQLEQHGSKLMSDG